MTAATFTQAAYRFYEDGTEAGSVAIAAQDTAITRVVTSDSNLFLRIRFQQTNAQAGAATDDYQLQRVIVRPGGIATPTGWQNVTTTSNAIKGFASGNVAEADPTTNRLTGGTGSFVAGKVSEDGVVDDLAITASNFTEFLYAITIDADEVGHGDIITLRVLRNAATTGLTFTVTPQITISTVATAAFGDILGVLNGGSTNIPNPASATGSVSVSVGDLVYALFSEQSNLTSTACDDNLGNTYTPINAGTDGGATGGRAFYTVVSSGHDGTLTSVDVTCTASALNYAVIAVAYKGPFASSPLDANPANGSTDVTSPIACPATGTLSQADELVVGGLCLGGWAVATQINTANLSVTSPQMLVATQHDTAGNVQGLGAVSWVVSATTDVTPSLTTSVNPSSCVLITASFKKEVSGAHQGEGDFDGAGNVSAAARLNQRVSAELLDGFGSLSASVISAQQAAARFAGAGNLSAKAEKFIFATFDGAGSVSARATLGEQAAATFAGAGALSVNTQVSKTGEATFQGAGSLSVAARLGHAALATFSGAGSVSIYANLSARIAATFGGSGSLSVDATQITAGGQAHVGEATFNGAGLLSANSQVSKTGEATFSGAGSLSALATLNQRAAATLQGAGALSAAATLNEAAAATFAGTGSLSAQADKSKAGEATFNGAGSLSALVTGRLVAFATFGGAGTFSVNTISAQRAAATFNGSGSLSAFSAPENVKVGEATFAGAGSLSANVTRQNLQAAAVFGGAGSLSVAARLGNAAFAVLGGAGVLSAQARQGQQAAARLDGSGSLSAVVTSQRMQISARFAGDGQFSVLVTQGNRAQITMEGRGDLSVDATVLAFGVHVGEAIFGGQGEMSVLALQFGPRRTKSNRTAVLDYVRSRSNTSQAQRSNVSQGVRPSSVPGRRTG